MTKEKIEEAIEALLEKIRECILFNSEDDYDDWEYYDQEDDYEGDYVYEFASGESEIRKILDGQHYALFLPDPDGYSITMISVPYYMDDAENDIIALNLSDWKVYMTERDNGCTSPIERIAKEINDIYKFKEIEIL